MGVLAELVVHSFVRQAADPKFNMELSDGATAGECQTLWNTDEGPDARRQRGML